jgi:CSLREA domain-containing protein
VANRVRRLVVIAILGGCLGAVLASPASAATISVTTANDELNTDGDCSLREAVQSAKVNGANTTGCADGELDAVDTIVLGSTTYTLDLGDPLNPTDENLNQTGDLDTGGGAVVVRGAGRESTTVTQVLNDRIFDASAAASGSLTIEALTVADGNTTFELTGEETYGGNVRLRSDGALIVRDARVTDGNARVGGGIYANGETGTVRIVDSLIDDNQAQVFGGGLNSGGGLVVRITRSTFDANHASGSGAQLLGGAISSLADITSDASMSISNSTITGNGVLNLLDTGNAVGGGIRARGPLTVRGTLIAGNTVNTLGSVDEPQNGGGIWQEGGPVALVNSTIYDNTAGNDNGDTAFGGGIYVAAGSTDIDHVTFASDFAEDAGSNIATGDGGGDGVSVGGSTLGSGIIFGDPCEEGTLPIASTGFNVAITEDPDCGFVASDMTDASDIYDSGVPEDNGGPTATIAITEESPAVDRVPKARCGPADGVDQRGYRRPSGRACDSGAYELTICNGEPLNEPGVKGCSAKCDRRPATISGTSGPDLLKGAPGQDVIAGLGGNDRLKGLSGNDILCGGRGNDRLFGGSGRDRLFGGPGKDRVAGGPGRDLERP